MKLNLSPFERLSLINQFEIRKALAKQDDVEHFEHLIEVLKEGYEFYYDDLARLDSYPESESSFVREVLHMYELIEDYKTANPNDKEVEDASFSRFFGFDGNEEGRHLGFVRYMFKRNPDWWTSIQKYAGTADGFNSHMPTTAVYQRMLAQLAEFGSSDGLSRQQVIAILAAAKHPASR